MAIASGLSVSSLWLIKDYLIIGKTISCAHLQCVAPKGEFIWEASRNYCKNLALSLNCFEKLNTNAKETINLMIKNGKPQMVFQK